MNSSCEYEYINEGLIDDDLKCSICHHPLVSPMSTDICGHTFCRQCIELWLQEHQTCPTCRRRVLLSNFSPVSTRVVLNLLNRISVQCVLCRKTNIERGNFSSHQKQCENRTVPCSFADLSCSWNGKEGERTEHEHLCPYRLVRPLVNELRSQNRILQSTVQKQAEQIRFLSIFLNNGKAMSQNCIRDDYCRIFFFSTDEQAEPKCNMCQIPHRLINVAVHHCDGGYLCQTCCQKYSPS